MSSEATSLALKADVYAAAWALKRDIYKVRMRKLRESAVQHLTTQSWWARLRGAKKNKPSEREIRLAMRDLWASCPATESWRILGWGTLATAESLISLAGAPGSRYVRITAREAVDLAGYWPQGAR